MPRKAKVNPWALTDMEDLHTCVIGGRDTRKAYEERCAYRAGHGPLKPKPKGRPKTRPDYQVIGELQQKRRDAVRGITRHPAPAVAPTPPERPLTGLEKLLTCERIPYGPVDNFHW